MVKHSFCPLIGLGTYKINQDSLTSALKNGLRHIDTATGYANEEMIGKVLEDLPHEMVDEIFITSKINPTDLIKGLKETVISSKSKLKKIDLLLIHTPHGHIPIHQVLSDLFELRRQGIIGNVGVSNFNQAELHYCLGMGFPISVNQVEYHPYYQQEQLFQFCQRNGVQLVGYRPLMRGLVLNDPVIIEMANRYHRSPAQIAWRWLLHKKIPLVTKVSHPLHQHELMTTLSFTINNDDLKRIDGLHRGESGRTCTGDWTSYDKKNVDQWVTNGIFASKG